MIAAAVLATPVVFQPRMRDFDPLTGAGASFTRSLINKPPYKAGWCRSVETVFRLPLAHTSQLHPTNGSACSPLSQSTIPCYLVVLAWSLRGLGRSGQAWASGWGNFSTCALIAATSWVTKFLNGRLLLGDKVV